MLKRLRFRNWRSLRDVEIDDLTAITVLIGANSSGKSNILDAMDFLRRIIGREESAASAFFKAERQNIRTIGSDVSEPIELEVEIDNHTERLRYMLGIETERGSAHFRERLTSNLGFELMAIDGKGSFTDPTQTNGGRTEFRQRNHETRLVIPLGTVTSILGDVISIDRLEFTSRFVTRRWQLLAENFMPWPTAPAAGLSGNSHVSDNLYIMDRAAQNTVLILDFMRNVFPGVYRHLEEDFRWLLDHVKALHTSTDERETRLMLFEAEHPSQEAPTISAGTARLLAILTAYHALDMRLAEEPGLVAIEEPDTAVHPLLLKHFVELLRTYVEAEHPRQFILTTHNPRLLDYFEPDEVRIVRRDEHGHTTVERVPDHIERIWLEKYDLGEVWMTRSLGDVE